MLNNLTNFFNLIAGRRIKTQLEPSDLIAVGTKQSPALGDYKPTAIKFEDLKEQLGGLQTVAVDGVTINGDGTLGNPLIAAIPSFAVNYSNVAFVDVINGNNSTGIINDFTKPFASASVAASAASVIPLISSSNRGLVIIRRGVYNSVLVNLLNNVDYYCEPGVVFTGASQIRDNGVAVNSNFYGHMKFDNAYGITTPAVRFTGASDIYFEFDSIRSSAAAIEVIISDPSNSIRIKGNRIFSFTLGQGYGVTVRDAGNVLFNISEKIEALHSVIAFRRTTGKTVINCPNVILAPGNIYGGNFKHAVIVYDIPSVGSIEINGSIICNDPINYGGISSLVRFWENPSPTMVINGNMAAVNDNCIVMSNGAPKVTYSGIIKTNRTAISVNAGTMNVRNATIIRVGSLVAGPVGVSSAGVLYINDATIYSEFLDGNIINIESNAARLYVKNVIAEGVGINYFVNVGAATPTVGLISAVSNKDNSPGFVNTYAVAGSFALEPNLDVPKNI